MADKCEGKCPYSAQRQVAEMIATDYSQDVREFANSAPNVVTSTEASAQHLISIAFDKIKEQNPEICKGTVKAPNREKPGCFCPVEQMARQAILTAGAIIHEKDATNTGQYL